jgi:phosphate:Na+ symporter
MTLTLLKNILTFAGGLGMFIYGMHIMAEGLQQAAGSKMKKLLSMLTNNRLLGVLVGALVTALIQSSSATTVMVVGFVNAQIMNLHQAIGVIMGANIGTTMTGWIVSMSEWGAIFKPDMFAPALVAIGAAMMLAGRKPSTKRIAHILIGFCILFVGLNTMSSAVKPYAEEPIFYHAFAVIGSNPIFGILVGAAVTAVIQSSSASMGILQTLAFNGVVNWSAAAFIALGQNIGTCVTALLSCIGAHKNAQRAAILHLLFNVIGSVLVGLVLWIYFSMNPAIASSTVSGTQLAMFHTGFNVATTIVLFPFANWMVSLSKKIIPESGKSESRFMVHLDDRLLQTPGIALEAVSDEMQNMGRLALENITLSKECLLNHEKFDQLAENEEKINLYQKEISDFLSEMDTSTLTEKQQLRVKHDILAVSDLERISDHCQSIARLAQEMPDSPGFSEYARQDINTIANQCYKTLKYALEIRDTKNVDAMDKVESYERKVDIMENLMREGHIQRLIEKKCNVESGIVFLDSISNYERMADHAELLAGYIVQEEQR